MPDELLDIFKSICTKSGMTVTKEAEDALKKYNLFKWSLSDLPSDDDATLLQIKMYEDKIKDLRDKLNPADH